jgi:hypothetical protein
MERNIDRNWTIVGLLWAMALAGCASAQTTVRFGPGEQARAMSETTSVSTCTFTDRGLPLDTIVVAAGGYAGHKVGFQIDQSGHEATQFDVAVHADKPVALLLGAYEPTIWNVGWSKGTRIVAVLATGYHRQAVAGLPKGTPVIVSSYETRGPCEVNYLGGEGGLDWLNPRARAVFGMPVTRVYARAADGLIDIVESARPKAPYETSPITAPEMLRDANALLAGDAGLRDAVAKGLLRLAAPEDLIGLREHIGDVRAGAAARRPGEVPPIAGALPGSQPVRAKRAGQAHRVYIVLKPFTFPPGLYGANAATFIVPKGVESPTGNPGHSAVYDLNE